MGTNKDTENNTPSAQTYADKDIALLSKVTEEELTEVLKDGHGVTYSKDGKKLLKISNNISHYNVIEGTEIICDEAFRNCLSLMSITIPLSVTTIGKEAFFCCEGLTEITIPPSVTSIGDSAFACCSNMASITIPPSVTTIGMATFSHCSSLTSIEIPPSVTTIGRSAFYACNNLDDATKSEILRRFGNRVFL